jgi:hypothetical protein
MSHPYQVSGPSNHIVPSSAHNNSKKRAKLQHCKVPLLLLGDLALFVPAIFLFWQETFSFSGWPNSISPNQKLDRQATNSFQFLDTMEIAPPHDCKILFSFQRRWLINSLIGDCQCTYYLIVRALTISIFCFSCSLGHSYKKILFLERFLTMMTMKKSSFLLCPHFQNTARVLCQRQGNCHHALFLPCTSLPYAPLLGKAERP